MVFLDDAKMILIELSPELVAVLSFKAPQSSAKYAEHNNNSYFINMAIKIGHTIGNLHRPLKLEENKIIFPIQSIEEIDLFQRLLPHLKDQIDIKTDNMIFEPDLGFDVHEH